ncbi:IF rod domain-containing protein [Balamuthia mandrillaris]
MTARARRRPNALALYFAFIMVVGSGLTLYYLFLSPVGFFPELSNRFWNFSLNKMSWEELSQRNINLQQFLQNMKPSIDDRLWQLEVENMLSTCEKAMNNTADAFRQTVPDVEAIGRLNAAIYFLHIEKCGGSTLWEFVKRNNQKSAVNVRFGDQLGGFELKWNDSVSLAERPELLKQAQHIFSSHKVIVGHYVHGVHKITPERPFLYFTVLRNPFDRLISQFDWWKRLYGDKHGRDIYDFLSNSTNKRRHKDNLQTRVLCGREAYFVPRGNLTYGHLLCAMEHLREQYTVVGTVERFEDTIHLLTQHFGWTKATELAFDPKNLNGKHQDQKGIQPDDVWEQAQPLIKYDEILYRYGRCLFERNIRGLRARGMWHPPRERLQQEREGWDKMDEGVQLLYSLHKDEQEGQGEVIVPENSVRPVSDAEKKGEREEIGGGEEEHEEETERRLEEYTGEEEYENDINNEHHKVQNLENEVAKVETEDQASLTNLWRAAPGEEKYQQEGAEGREHNTKQEGREALQDGLRTQEQEVTGDQGNEDGVPPADLGQIYEDEENEETDEEGEGEEQEEQPEEWEKERVAPEKQELAPYLHEEVDDREPYQVKTNREEFDKEWETRVEGQERNERTGVDDNEFDETEEEVLSQLQDPKPQEQQLTFEDQEAREIREAHLQLQRLLQRQQQEKQRNSALGKEERGERKEEIRHGGEGTALIHR